MKQERFKLIPAVFLLLKNADGKMLLSQRLNKGGYGNGQYSLVAGHAEDGESLATAMIREASEESGMLLKSSDLSLAHALHYTSQVDGYKAVFFFFTTSKWQGEIKNMEPEKCSDLHWFPIDTLPENTIPYVRQAIECIQKGVTCSKFGWE
jgi:8-oxo-dGTP pyrophosphatase MutT (NUDIX family)